MHTIPKHDLQILSPSSRRAWIEMVHIGNTLRRWMVALLAEGVDRNDVSPVALACSLCRPPRGGRG